DPRQVTTVSGIKIIPNQNLHEIQKVDYLIVYHPLFSQSSTKLADHRRQYNGFEVRTVNILDIYNEFSSGKTDPSALRNFRKRLYSRGNPAIRVLLLGDGSFDYKFNSARVIIQMKISYRFTRPKTRTIRFARFPPMITTPCSMTGRGVT